MQLNVPPDLEALINKRLSSGGYANAEDVLRRALEAQDAEESKTLHYLTYVKREIISRETNPPDQKRDVTIAAWVPRAHVFGQKWLYDLSKAGKNLVIWQISVLRGSGLPAVPSIDARDRWHDKQQTHCRSVARSAWAGNFDLSGNRNRVCRPALKS
jgi:hypothetical protein